jgi:predicted transcriptional regulator
MDELHDGGGIVQRTTEYPHGLQGSGASQTPATDESSGTAEEIIFLEPGEERAQNIVKAMSHQNAGEVVQLLSQNGPLRLSDIAERMHLSLNAAKYHIENLMTAGILEISNTRYSVKGKKVKIYRLKNQVFIVSPHMNSLAQVRTVLMKYCAALTLFVGVFGVVMVQPVARLPSVPMQNIAGAILSGSGAPTAVMTNTTVIPALIIAAAVTLLLLVACEVHGYYRNLTVPD